MFQKSFFSAIPEAHLEPWETSSMELFAEIVNGGKPLTIFAKKQHFRCLIGFIDYPLASIESVILLERVTQLVKMFYSKWQISWISPQCAFRSDLGSKTRYKNCDC